MSKSTLKLTTPVKNNLEYSLSNIFQLLNCNFQTIDDCPIIEVLEIYNEEGYSLFTSLEMPIIEITEDKVKYSVNRFKGEDFLDYDINLNITLDLNKKTICFNCDSSPIKDPIFNIVIDFRVSDLNVI